MAVDIGYGTFCWIDAACILVAAFMLWREKKHQDAWARLEQIVRKWAIIILLANTAISLFFIAPYLRYEKLQDEFVMGLQVYPQPQIQLTQDGALCAFNVLCTLIARGGSESADTITFTSADVAFPNGNKFFFACRSYIDEKGLGQENASRNIPIAVKGNQIMNITSGYQMENGSIRWEAGQYAVQLHAIDLKGNSISIPLLQFELSPNDIAIISKPLAVEMHPAIISSALSISDKSTSQP